MIIEFEEKTHTYAVNGDIANISVTELLHKHGLAPDYSGVSKATLSASAKKGKEIHKDFECCLNTANYEPKTPFGKLWIEWIEKNLSSGVAEQMLAYNYNGLIIAGTADMVGFTVDGEAIILDHKPKGTPTEYVTWQVNLLDYMARNYGGQMINSRPFRWKGAKHFYANFYDKTNEKINIVELEKIPDTEIERLINCEFNNQIYERRELVIEESFESVIEQLESECAIKKAEYELAKAKLDELHSELIKSFVNQKIEKWKTNDGKYSYTYIPPQVVLTVDSTKLRRDFPVIYGQVVKETNKKAYLKVKENNDGDS